MSPGIRILILNPNSSKEMTEGIRKAIESTQPVDSCSFRYYTAPAGSPASINDGADLAASTHAVLADLTAGGGGGDSDLDLDGYDAVLVACYSVHPLVQRLAARRRGRAVVLGIFEASVLTALSLSSPYPAPGPAFATVGGSGAWGIVTTGEFWGPHLAEGVAAFLGQHPDQDPVGSAPRPLPRASNRKFAGVFTTGLTAGDFHGAGGVAPEVVAARLKDATRRLLASRRVGCVVMGCAGMAGLEEIIRSAIKEEYGESTRPEDKVYIIDGVKAGAGLLVEAVKNERMFGQ